MEASAPVPEVIALDVIEIGRMRESEVVVGEKIGIPREAPSTTLLEVDNPAPNGKTQVLLLKESTAKLKESHLEESYHQTPPMPKRRWSGAQIEPGIRSIS